MAFTPRAPKQIIQREFTDVQFVYGETWTWQIPSYFTVAEQARIKQIPFTHAHNYLKRELNKPIQEDDRPPSQIVSRQEQAAEMILSTLASQKKGTRIIPDDAMIQSIINRFNKFIGENEWSDAVSKEQLDIICLPKDGAPKLSSVYDRADKELMNDALSFFYSNPLSTMSETEEPTQSLSDSGKEEKPSKEVQTDIT